MTQIDFTERLQNKKPIQKRRTKKRLDTTPLKRSKKQQYGGVSLKGVSHKASKIFQRSKFSLFRETSIKIIDTLDKLNRYLSFENINKKTNNKQFHNKLLGKKIILDNYYQNKELNDYLKLSYRVSGARTSQYENPFYLCTTYKQGSIALIKALKYIAKTFRLGPRGIFNLLTFSTKGMKKVYDEFFDKNDGFKKKYRNNENVICYIAKLITYFHNLNTYIHEFKVLYDNLKDEYKSDLSKENAGKLGVFFNYEINNYIKGFFKENNTYSGIQEIDYRNTNYLQLPENMNSLNDKLIIKYKILEHVTAVKLNKKNKLHLITPKLFNFTTQRNEDGKLVKVPKDKEIRMKYGAFVVNILIGQVFKRLQTLKTKLKTFYDIYTFPEIAPVVKFYTGRKARIGEISLFKSQKTDMMDDKSFFEEVRKLSDAVDSRLEPFLNYLNAKVYDLKSDSSDSNNFEKYKIIMQYQKIVNYLKKMKQLFSENVGESIRKEYIDLIFKKIIKFIDENSEITINYFGIDDKFDINITKASNNSIDMIDTINKQFKLEKQLNKELINKGNRDEINKFFDGVIIYFNKRRAEYEGLRGDLVETTAIKTVQRQSGGANLCYPIITKEKLRQYYDKLMELCNKNICLKDVEKVRKGEDPKLRNSKGIGKPIGLESRYIKINFRNYILKIMMGNIYFDEDMIHSKLPFKDDIDRALQFIPYYIQGKYFKARPLEDKYTDNFSNFVYLSNFVNKEVIERKYEDNHKKRDRISVVETEERQAINKSIQQLKLTDTNIYNTKLINDIKDFDKNQILEPTKYKVQSEEIITLQNKIKRLNDEKNELEREARTLGELITKKGNLDAKIKELENLIEKLQKNIKDFTTDSLTTEVNKVKGTLTKLINELNQNLTLNPKKIQLTIIDNIITQYQKLNQLIGWYQSDPNDNNTKNETQINVEIKNYTTLKHYIELITKTSNFSLLDTLEKLDLVKDIVNGTIDNIKNKITELQKKITDEGCPKFKTSKYPLSFANLSLLTPLEIASLNGLDDAGNLQVIMGEKGFEELNKRLRKSFTQRMKKFFGVHMMVDIKIEIKGEGDSDGDTYTKRYLTSKGGEMDNINSIIKTLITSRGGDKKSKVKFGAGVLGIAGILGLVNPVLAVPFVVGVLLNNRNRRELYKYQTLEQVLEEFNIRLKKNEKLLKFYNDEIKNKGLEDEFRRQVKGYFNLSRNVKFHDLYLHNNIEGYQDHKTTTEDILNNLIFLGKKVSDKEISNEIILKGRGLSDPFKFIISKIDNNGKYDKEKLKILAKSVIIRLLERKKINVNPTTANTIEGGGIIETMKSKVSSAGTTIKTGVSSAGTTIKTGVSSAKTSIYEFGVENIRREDLPYTYKFNKIDDKVKTDLLNVIKKFTNNYKPNSSLEKFIYNIFTDTNLDMYGSDVLYAVNDNTIFENPTLSGGGLFNTKKQKLEKELDGLLNRIQDSYKKSVLSEENKANIKTNIDVKTIINGKTGDLFIKSTSPLGSPNKIEKNDLINRITKLKKDINNADDTVPHSRVGRGLLTTSSTISSGATKAKSAISSYMNDKTFQLDKIILLLGLNRIVESLLYYLQNVDSIKKTLDETKQLLSRGTTKKHNTKPNPFSIKGGGNGNPFPTTNLEIKINTEKRRLENTRLGDIQSDKLIGTSATLQHSLLRRNYNGMSETGLIDGIDSVAIKMILYYRNNLLDLQQSENLLRQEFPNITKDLLRKYFHKVLTKLLVYLRCNEISYDYFHSAHYHLSKETKGKKQEQESEIAKLSNEPLEILNNTQDDLEKNAELTAKILITEIQELSYYVAEVISLKLKK